MTKHAAGTIYPLSALRALALHTQHLSTPDASTPAATPDALVDLATALGYIQIDTLHVVHRAHEVTVWSRFGAYATSDLHRLLYTASERRLYEGWGHAASIIPLQHYRYHRWRMDRDISYNPGFRDWLSNDDNRALAARTLERIRAEGGLRVGDFADDGPQRGAWYDWKPTKMALEALFAQGEVMVSERVNFQRVYDIRERVLPSWVDTTPVSPDDARRFCLEEAARALGVFEPHHLTFYAYMKAAPARPLVRTLIAEGALVAIRGESMAGVQKWLVHRDNLPLLQWAAEGELRPQRTTFLAPFDSVFWAGDRDEKLWGFRQLLECYKPASRRIYGYFCFPILHHDQLVGRFDPRLDRSSGRLHLSALYLEPDIEPDDEQTAAIGTAMRDFLAWHGATDLRIERSDPPAFGEKLLRAL
jgi:hypothetical protein